ncbi:MAG: hypothetical protein RSC06_14080 [Clostridia bacterium]
MGCNLIFEKAIPFLVGKGNVVQLFQLTAQVFHQTISVVEREILIPLLREHFNKSLFKRNLALIAVRTLGLRLVLGDDGALGGGGIML